MYNAKERWLSMEIKTGYLYFLKKQFYEKVNDPNIMGNKKNTSRPTYLTFKEDEILWFIPLSKQIEKYEKQILYKEKKYKKPCDNILIRKIAGEKSAILIQNAFPTLEKYVDSVYTKKGEPLKIAEALKDEVLTKFKKTRKLKLRGIETMFVNIVKLEKMMRDELLEDHDLNNKN